MTYKILVVDDSKLARMAVAKLLNALRPSWTRIEASSAAEAISIVKSSAIDVALVDYNMPDRDGLQLAADIRALNSTMPLAVISANHQKEVVGRANDVGAQFLSKPLNDKTLREFVEFADEKLKAQGR